MSINLDSFSGYMTIEDSVYTFYLRNQIVTLLPAYPDAKDRDDAISLIPLDHEDKKSFVYGYDENLYNIAMLNASGLKKGKMGISPIVRFSTPLVIRSAGNASGFYFRLTEDWTKFHAITFVGGIINSIYDPRKAIIQPLAEGKDGKAKLPQIRDASEYTKTVKVNIGRECAELNISVMNSGFKQNPGILHAYNMGEMNSYIRLSFDHAQEFDRIEQYILTIKALISILVKQENIRFDVYLSQRDSQGQYVKSAYCKIYDEYENYSEKTIYQVINIDWVFNCIPNIIELLETSKLNIIHEVLPHSNQDLKYISITNVQDICTALEVAYDWSTRHQEKDEYIKGLKKCIKTAIAEYVKTHPGTDPNNETTLSSSFSYLSFSLKQKINTLYLENKDLIDIIVSRNQTPEINIDTITSFVNLRNGKTHSGVFSWNDNAKIFYPLFTLVYICLLRYFGLDDEMIKMIIVTRF